VVEEGFRRFASGEIGGVPLKWKGDDLIEGDWSAGAATLSLEYTVQLDTNMENMVRSGLCVFVGARGCVYALCLTMSESRQRCCPSKR
jgi:hypothetical protein